MAGLNFRPGRPNKALQARVPPPPPSEDRGRPLLDVLAPQLRIFPNKPDSPSIWFDRNCLSAISLHVAIRLHLSVTMLLLIKMG